MLEKVFLKKVKGSLKMSATINKMGLVSGRSLQRCGVVYTRTTVGYLAAACLLVMTLAVEAKPLKVYILAGQSNMVGQAHVSTFPHIGMDPKTAPLLKEMLGPDGKPRVLDDVYIAYEDRNGKLSATFGVVKGGPKVGPEYTFGIYMHKTLQEPFLIIKTAWGGKNLYNDFRPPSAGIWTPPAGHPDLIKEKPKALPIPASLDLPVDYKPSKEYFDPYARTLGYNLLKRMRGCAIGEHNGVHPIYIVKNIVDVTNFPLQEGDIMLGINGSGLRDNPKTHWRTEIQKVFSTDMKLNVTRWRAGKIETLDIDLAEFLHPGGRVAYNKMKEEDKTKPEPVVVEDKSKGLYYRMMISEIKNVLGDIKKVYPDYDPDQGYELSGFVWLQGWNDMIDKGTYPNSDKPQGYEQYSWLLAHLIRDVRKELDAPKMPVVIGVMGVGGIKENPDYFRLAMAAPADYPEFKGNVKAVYTENYWDKQLSDLVDKSQVISSKRTEFSRKDGLLGEALEKAVAEFEATVLTPEEKKILAIGVSNKPFHYLGSSKIIGQIGKAFAEAMLEF